ncbi:MAG: threonine/serine dehydratase [Candidatus Sumerlaeota bacterium]|nr:threonine/serine dehydratase [Candidatus Sumerlaeota bacterium]
MIGIQDVYAARERLAGHIYRTPLIKSEAMSALLDAEIFFKLENLQVTNAFKIRGSTNKILQLTDEEKRYGVICASSGNHAQGFSCAARRVGVDALVVMPRSAPKTKAQKCRDYGATVLIEGEYYDDSVRVAKELSQREKRTYISSFDDEQVIAGNGTMGLEIFEDCPEVDVIIAPIGGGGLTSGLGFVKHALHPRTRLIGVEAEGAPSMYAAIQAGHVASLSSISTIADGIAVGTPGTINFDYVRRFVDHIELVTDDEIRDAMRLLWDKMKIVVEPAGAASCAAAIKMRGELKGKKTACIVTGGNVDKELYLEMLTLYGKPVKT